ncbi:hypothetical protein PIB30_089851 [Stylosanthes scabra]|uniref:Uncharacterized protein n=1 Tax=Stylosanthes scabra TaxID=79078 RepID=A0ABU6QTK3_9FABA|nr:hypothetical protein [Stylosanthes scabra]
MAIKRISQVCLFLLIILFSNSFMMLNARSSFHGQHYINPKKNSNVDSYKLFRKLGFDQYASRKQHIHYHIRDGGDELHHPGDRLSPGGPNPHHNSEPPSNK